MRVLVVEDDEVIAGLLQQGLEDAGYTVVVAYEGREGLREASESAFHLILLDVMLPGLDGMAVCKALRDRRNRTPILMLTARDAVDDKVRGLDSGADDYLAKPFDFKELLARVRALTRRERAQKSNLIRVADLEIDTVEHRATRGGRELSLSHREYELLVALASHERQVFTREMILERVWMSEPTTSNVVDVFIKSLRKKVDEGHESKLIQTVWGVGYTLRGPE
ncbi:response regulator transcription factor [Armatimonas rosea]|uniref:DNA-binding response OmpR family regulator n=1 Tax=Armatimonas rosea TaxID=685828 RepID=A0A7W9W5D1_ARMRO|nr:response regulator transcription factor [Armatimonas rosea]MBB6050314.1 DNA-binding response OmpR family regulator [Armatimonas rosea]